MNPDYYSTIDPQEAFRLAVEKYSEYGNESETAGQYLEDVISENPHLLIEYAQNGVLEISKLGEIIELCQDDIDNETLLSAFRQFFNKLSEVGCDWDIYINALDGSEIESEDIENIKKLLIDFEIFLDDIESLLIDDSTMCEILKKFAKDGNADEVADFIIERKGYLEGIAYYKIAEWLFYQDEDSYEYSEPLIEKPTELAGFLNDYPDWDVHEDTGLYALVLAARFGYRTEDDKYLFPIYGNDRPYLEGKRSRTSPESELILSETYYDYYCNNPEMIDEKEVLRVLELSDVRRIQVNDFKGFKNKNAKEIFDRLDYNTAVAIYYCYDKLGNPKAGINRLRKSGISELVEDLVVFSNNTQDGFLIPNPLFKKNKSSKSTKKNDGKTPHIRKKKSFLSKLKKKLWKLFR